MRAIAMTIRATTRCVPLSIAAVVFLAAAFQVQAATPSFYSADTNRVFWFIHASDLHIGASGSDDSNRLTWLVNTGRQVIQPNFIVVTGDLTDSTNGNIFGYPNGPYQAEWDQYKNILSAAGVTASSYYDLPGNHDAYNDKYFAYYLAYSLQGRATSSTQLSWTRTFDFGTYRFVGANTADNTGASFSLISPYGDHAGLDSNELTFLSTELAKPADLTLVFGHHPVTSTGNSTDTYLYYGHQEFLHALDLYRVGRYGYGHTHSYAESLFQGNTYTGLMTGPGLDYVSVASLARLKSVQRGRHRLQRRLCGQAGSRHLAGGLDHRAGQPRSRRRGEPVRLHGPRRREQPPPGAGVRHGPEPPSAVSR